MKYRQLVRADDVTRVKNILTSSFHSLCRTSSLDAGSSSLPGLYGRAWPCRTSRHGDQNPSNVKDESEEVVDQGTHDEFSGEEGPPSFSDSVSVSIVELGGDGREGSAPEGMKRQVRNDKLTLRHETSN